mmetsp:Transcript_75846/g.126454  ORF Transcript_75846/g.126454 Transcript_75846/m.126454 type:complete len:234 (+) Transcript_75846:98-799(+)
MLRIFTAFDVLFCLGLTLAVNTYNPGGSCILANRKSKSVGCTGTGIGQSGPASVRPVPGGGIFGCFLNPAIVWTARGCSGIFFCPNRNTVACGTSRTPLMINCSCNTNLLQWHWGVGWRPSGKSAGPLAPPFPSAPLPLPPVSSISPPLAPLREQRMHANTSSMRTSQKFKMKGDGSGCGLAWSNAHVLCYLLKNPDLMKEPILRNNLNAARCHYVQHGQKEERVHESAECTF